MILLALDGMKRLVFLSNGNAERVEGLWCGTT
jgi:hypothetical protein